MQAEEFFEGLERKLAGAQRERRRAAASMFAGIAPRLDSAKRLDRELDQHLARRFNVLDYLRTDELGLSRIIADLLNPRASHGQAAFFLSEFLNLLRERSSLQAPAALKGDRVQVAMEHEIENKRRIDILATITGRESTWALAIENKPYAGDQKNQVRDYLRHLRCQYKQNFLLIYLSPTGEGPSGYSVKRSELQKCWQDNFATLPYHQHDSAAEPDGIDTESDRSGAEPEAPGMRRLSFSLSDWLQACRRNCEVERLRWFLGDAIQFCRTTFGDHTMTSKHESKTIRDYLFEHPEHLETALAVHDSWPAVRDEICKTFLERLADRIRKNEQLRKLADDLEIGCAYVGRPRYSNKLWLYRKQWHKYEGGDTLTTQRTTICIQSDGYGPNNWCVGVRSPLIKAEMKGKDKDRRESIEQSLVQTSAKSRQWAKWEYLGATARNWDSLVQDLFTETDQPGEITRYIVGKIINVAREAIPVINEFDA